MKALILAAGYGTRLLPYTEDLPKALFPVLNRPILDINIRRLIHAGCTGIIINTHHMSEKIDGFIARQGYPIRIITRFEEKILGTGGAIKNVSDFFENLPFMVINSDIITDVDLKAVYAHHLKCGLPATLVMHDYPMYNTVWVDPSGYISGFDELPDREGPGHNRLAFTGIQVLNPEVIRYIPERRPVSSIDVYRHILRSGLRIKAFVAKNHYWRDIGTPESYMEAIYERTAHPAFEKAFGRLPDHPIRRTPLTGDGSDRRWYRLLCGEQSLLMVDHGIKTGDAVSEMDAFVNIGRHLHGLGVSVPEIYLFDTFSGLVYLEDLGDINLQKMVCDETDKNRIIHYYQAVIDQMLTMWVEGARTFEPAWAFQTPSYDRQLILERECRYFVDAFLNTYLKMGVSYDRLKNEFSALADTLLDYAVPGLIHRDLQSRNIMVKNNAVYLIDFQGARAGPIQYDLAALLEDPYVSLSENVQARLLEYCISRLQKRMDIDKANFLSGYRLCALSRMLQAIGAFAFLTGVKQKPFFEQYIPVAAKNLYNRLTAPGVDRFPGLTCVVEKAIDSIQTRFDKKDAKDL